LRLVVPEEHLWGVCEEVFWNYPEENTPSMYFGAHQIVNTIYKEIGGDKFASQLRASFWDPGEVLPYLINMTSRNSCAKSSIPLAAVEGNRDASLLSF
jgi:hypothetical protein